MKRDSQAVHRGDPALAWIAVVLLFVGSGCAALVHEVVWFRLLRRVVGRSWISLGILLAYLAGLSLRTAQADAIFQEIAAYRRYPADILRNDAAYKDDIQQRLGLPKAAE